MRRCQECLLSGDFDLVAEWIAGTSPRDDGSVGVRRGLVDRKRTPEVLAPAQALANFQR